MTTPFFRCCLALLSLCSAARPDAALAQLTSLPLNDTGQTRCYNGTTLVACNASSAGDGAVYPRQDGRFGRDARGISKTGAGAAGFDFTRLCMSGATGCAGTANTTESPAPQDWACVKDNQTQLTWSLYSGQGDWTTLARTALPTSHNAQNRCGFSTGWRLPTRRELLSMVHLGQVNPPKVDSVNFPGARSARYWSSDAYQPAPTEAWYVDFSFGNTGADLVETALYVRLVRSAAP